MSIEAKLTELNLTLPTAPAAVAAYQPWIRTGNLVFTSGHLPFHDGAIAYAGKLGGELTAEDGYQAARQCALNAIAQLKAATGDLEKIQKIVRIEGYVNGASDLVAELFGERGQHTRLALGINEMPLNAAVQLAMTAEVAD